MGPGLKIQLKIKKKIEYWEYIDFTFISRSSLVEKEHEVDRCLSKLPHETNADITKLGCLDTSV